MSPFSVWFSAIRKRHRKSQTKLARELGYEQAYVSGIELGRKKPSRDFLERLVVALQISEAEQAEMHLALKKSRRRYVLSSTATLATYEIYYAFCEQLDHLYPAQIEIIRQTLSLSTHAEQEVDMSQR